MKTNMWLMMLCVVVLGWNAVGWAEVIGDFEEGLDGWDPWVNGDGSNPFVLETSTLQEAVTRGRHCLRLSGVEGAGKYWGLSITAPNDINMPESLDGMALQFDVTMIQSEWTSGIWTKVGGSVALNSDGPDEWKEFSPLKVVDRVSGESVTSWDWGNWSPNAYKTIVVDISDYNVTDATWLTLAITVQQNDGEGAGYFYIDNIQLVSGAGGGQEEDLPTLADPVIASFEQDLDDWELEESSSVDILYNDQNGVTDGNYCLDVWFPANDWHQFMTLDVMDSNSRDVILENQKIAMDITRVADDYPDYPTDTSLWPWNNFNMAIEVWDDQGNGIWTWMGEQANWTPREGDPNEPNKPMTTKAVWNYGQFIDDNIPDRDAIGTFRLMLVSNTNSGDYDGEVWFYLDNVQVFGGGKASAPNPGNYGINVPVDSTASWLPGAFANTHHFYFGSDATEVSDANQDSDPNVTFRVLDDTNVDLTPFDLDFSTVYYWRVDEINEAHTQSPWKGEVWRFTTADFWVVDDFEDYNDFSPDRVFDTWFDGYDIDENGSQIGYSYEPFGETEIVHGGSQSVPLFYDNTDGVTESAVTRTWTETQDFTVNGYNVLSLFIYGREGNTSGQISVALTDSSGNTATVTSDLSDFYGLEAWTEVTFSLQAFEDQGLDAAAVETLVISIANLDGQEDAQGDLLIDDIRVGL